MRSISLVILFLLTIINSVASDQSCTAADATVVDTQLSLIGVAASDALLLEVEADLAMIIKRDFSCKDGFKCYSIKSYLLCYNPSTHGFITALGTTGNTRTGDYQLANGSKGNLYRGPWPSPTTDQGAGTSIGVYNTGSTAVKIIASQNSGPWTATTVGAAGPTSAGPILTGAASTGPTPAGGSATSTSLPLATHNGALRIQQSANAVWGIGALLAWAILP